MKSIAAIAAAGTVSAYGADAMNALHIKVSPWGQKQIEKEGADVHRVAQKIKNAPATKSLKGALHKWAHSKAAMRVKALDQKFIRSNDGKRLIKEWKDVGRVLKKNIHQTPNGVHFNNGAMNKLDKELDDVSDHYEYLGKTHWAGKYKMAYKKLFTNAAFNKVKFAAKNFKHSPAGKMLKKEVMELGQALKQHVKVSDVPAKWKAHMHGLRVDFEEDAEEEINGAAEHVKHTWASIEHSPVVQNVGKHAMEWGTSHEVKELKALDEKFKRSAEGQALMKEWQEFGEALHKAIEETPTGIHIHNSKMDALEDRVDDIKEDYEDLEDTHWNHDFEEAFHNAFENDEAHALHGALKKFKHSPQGHKLGKSLHNLGETIHDNVHVSDIPEEWMEDMNGEMSLYGDRLAKNERVGPAQPAKFIQSGNGRYRWHVQTDGNTCIAKSFNNWANQVNVWCLNTGVNPAGTVNPYWVHQTDGNACVYHNNAPGGTWCTNTAGKLTSTFVMQNDGNACLYWGARALWCSGTQGK